MEMTIVCFVNDLLYFVFNIEIISSTLKIIFKKNKSDNWVTWKFQTCKEIEKITGYMFFHLNFTVFEYYNIKNCIFTVY